MKPGVSWEHDKSEISIGLQYENPTANFGDNPGAISRKSGHIDQLYRFN
jgi:hypothetical protein